MTKFFKKFSDFANSATCEANTFAGRALSAVFVIPVPHPKHFVANGSLEKSHSAYPQYIDTAQHVERSDNCSNSSVCVLVCFLETFSAFHQIITGFIFSFSRFIFKTLLSLKQFLSKLSTCQKQFRDFHLTEAKHTKYSLLAYKTAVFNYFFPQYYKNKHVNQPAVLELV